MGAILKPLLQVARWEEHCCAQPASTADGLEIGGDAHPAENTTKVQATMRAARAKKEEIVIFMDYRSYKSWRGRNATKFCDAPSFQCVKFIFIFHPNMERATRPSG